MGEFFCFQEDGTRALVKEFAAGRAVDRAEFEELVGSWGSRTGFVRGLAGGHESGTFGHMSMTVDQIVEEIRSLPRDVVADLVDRVLMESHGGQESTKAQAWSSTVHRRIAEIRSGAVEGIPGDETAAKIRRIVGR